MKKRLTREERILVRAKMEEINEASYEVWLLIRKKVPTTLQNRFLRIFGSENRDLFLNLKFDLDDELNRHYAAQNLEVLAKGEHPRWD